jgi:hypothetical protein
MSGYSYSYDAISAQFTPYDLKVPVNCLYFKDQCGDPQLPSGPGIFGQYKYVDSPNGPQIQGSGSDQSMPFRSLRGTFLPYLETQLGQCLASWFLSEILV